MPGATYRFGTGSGRRRWGLPEQAAEHRRRGPGRSSLPVRQHQAGKLQHRDQQGDIEIAIIPQTRRSRLKTVRAARLQCLENVRYVIPRD